MLAAEAVWDAGVVPVTSAGNYGDKGNFTINPDGEDAHDIGTVGVIGDAAEFQSQP